MNVQAPSRTASQRGILTKTAAADRGLIALPALTPHLEHRTIGDGQVLLVSDSFNTLLHGEIYCDLLPLLDGQCPQDEVVASLSVAHAAADLRDALIALAARGYVVSGEHSMERGRAAFWSALGASPRWAEQRLNESRFAVVGDDGRLARQLERMGATASADRPSLSVIVCDDYLDDGHDAVNRRHIAARAPWMLVRPKGVQPLFGPVFRPADDGPCWACLAYRLRSHQEVHGFLRNRGGDGAAFRPCAAEPVILDSLYGLVAAEIAKWLVLEDAAPLHERAISLDIARLSATSGNALRRAGSSLCRSTWVGARIRTPKTRSILSRSSPERQT